MTDALTTAPGLILAAPTSGAGKTTLSMGLMRALSRSGLRIAPAKIGPDYIDPRFHDAATDRISINLDGWAMRPKVLDGLIADLSRDSDLILVEGVMGLFDGSPAVGACDTGSTADLAARTGWPVILVVDAARQAQSVAALVQGFRDFRSDVDIAGVILNRVGSDRHVALLRDALAGTGMPVLGAIPRETGTERPSRHLGLEQAGEDADLSGYLDRLADVVERTLDLDVLRNLAQPSRISGPPSLTLPPLGGRIAVAQDAAFSFLYPHVLDGWRRAGSEILPFSPLADQAPDLQADAVYLPGGYPELHAAQVSQAAHFRAGMAAAAGRGAAVFGECGGFMVLGTALIDAKGARHPMLDLLPLVTRFDRRRLHLGYRIVTTLRDTPFGPAGTRLRGHEFHYSVIGEEGEADRPFQVTDARDEDLGSTGLARGSVYGSYLHLIDRSDG
ncbi:MAG: cobyrinate a,c-diamide synthase [Alphaproteobacteria bacterium]|nr:cobyrinate a,c-diamide synthase [Alphaproteobacteria bacterium]